MCFNIGSNAGTKIDAANQFSIRTQESPNIERGWETT